MYIIERLNKFDAYCIGTRPAGYRDPLHDFTYGQAGTETMWNSLYVYLTTVNKNKKTQIIILGHTE